MMIQNKSTRFFFILLAGILVALGGLWRCFRPAKKPNVILISLDTCRADHLSCYGYERDTTPHIDAIAEQGVLFTHVFSPVPLTLPSHTSLFTGRIPISHGVHDNLFYRLGDDALTLAEILRQRGYTTGAVISAYILDSEFGLSQGFDSYEYSFQQDPERPEISQGKGEEANRLAITWLEQHARESFFLFLHYYDPHDPYDPPEPFAQQYKDQPYTGEVAYTDYCVGEIIDKLKSLGLYDSSLLIITADHGEGLKEHDEGGHSYYIYQSNIQVPLVFKLPGDTNPRRIEDPVALVDILPTLLAYLHIPVPPGVHGEDLSPYLKNKGGVEQPRYIYSESLTATRLGCSPLLGITSDDWKYIQTSKPELYNLAADPHETDNLIGQEPQRASHLRNRLQEIITEFGNTAADSADRIRPDADSIQRVQALGYMGSVAVQDSFEFDQDKEDAKDLLPIHERVQLALNFVTQKKYDEARILLTRVLAERPDVLFVYNYLASIALSKGDLDEAFSYLTEYIEISSSQEDDRLHLKPNLAGIYNNLAGVFIKREKLDKAIECYQKALEIDPRFGEVRINLAFALAQKGQLKDALLYFTEAIQGDPDLSTAKAHYHMGTALAQQGKFEEAVTQFSQASRLSPQDPLTQLNVAKALLRLGRTSEAVEHYREALRLQPQWPEVANNLAWTLATAKSANIRAGTEAVALAREACAGSDYRNPSFLDTLASAYAEVGQFEDAVRVAEEAIEWALFTGETDLATAVEGRLKLYQSGRPYRGED